MSRFLIDVNLPCYFSLWNTNDFIFVRDLNPKMKDSEIWEYAEKNNLTIVTKDSDFSKRIIIKNPPPKIIHVKLGNLSMNNFFTALVKIWDEIIEYNKDFKLVTVYKDKIEAIN